MEKVAVARFGEEGFSVMADRAAALLNVFNAPYVGVGAAYCVALVGEGDSAKLKSYKVSRFTFLVYSVQFFLHACIPHFFACFPYCCILIIAV